MTLKHNFLPYTYNKIVYLEEGEYMVYQNFHTIHFQPVRDYLNYNPNYSVTDSFPTGVQNSIFTNDYIARGLTFIQYIVRFIQSTSAFIEEHIEIIRELP